ncbi:MAG: hypothetical protein IT368_05835, partial [Candidatus Hydrogenedentes bacterium]|nr:hypothetical protein [Candidatus Hydrogenedentota bacterium]
MQKNAVVLAILFCCCTSATAAPVGFTTMHLDAEQAFVPWGMPLEEGPIRAVLVAPQYTARDGVALSQRIELDLTLVPLQTRDSLADEEDREAVLNDFRRAISGRIDLIILANIDAAAIPEEDWAAVAERVRSGVGLVLANHDLHDAPALQDLIAQGSPVEDLRPITAGISEGITPEWTSGIHFVQSVLAGEGRIVTLDYGPDRPATQALLPPLIDPLLAFPEFLDTYYSLIAKAVRWAARRDPRIFVDAVLPAGPAGPREEEIPPQLPAEFLQRMRDAAMPGLLHPYALRLSEAADRDYDVIVQTRRLGRSHEEIFTQELSVAKGTGEVRFDLYGGAGQYLVDFWLTTRKGVSEWHTATVQLPGWPEFKNLRFSKDFILPNDAIDISVDVRPHFAQPRPCSLYARSLDLHGRLVSEVTVEVPEDGGLAMATLPFADVLTPMLKVEAYLVDSPARPFAQWELNAAAFE